MTNRDYKNYDYLNVSVKKSRVQALVDMYTAFLWEEIEREEHDWYDDILNITFRRAHAVPGKDELQFLQVCAESEFNRIDKLLHTKHFASAAFGIPFGLAGCLLLICGIVVACLFRTTLFIVSGCLLAVSGAAIVTLTAIAARVLFKGEKARCEEQCERHKKIISDICLRVNTLTGNGL